MNHRKRITVSILGLVFLAYTIAAANAEEPTPVEMVDGLNAVFGKHPHTRASHAKGFCVSGNFTPAPGAASLSKAPQFAKPVPLLGRFSLGGGNPRAPDNAKSNVRGLETRSRRERDQRLRDDLSPCVRRQDARAVPGAAQAFASGDPEKPKAFFAAHLELTRQGAWLNERPVPASYASVNYFGVHAFTLTNAEGKQQLVKLKAVPKAGEQA